MRRTVLSTFLFVAILGLGCIGVAVPGKAEELKDGKYFASHTNGDGYIWTLELILKNQKIIKTKIAFDASAASGVPVSRTFGDAVENRSGHIFPIDFNPKSGMLSGWLRMTGLRAGKITGKFPKLSMWTSGRMGNAKWDLVRQLSEREQIDAVIGYTLRLEEERLAEKKAEAEKQRLAELARKLADVNIKELQEGLSVLGFYGGKLTGKNNLETISSIQNWQAKEGLLITGAISSDQAIKIKRQAIALIDLRKKLELNAEESFRKLAEAKAAAENRKLAEAKATAEKKRLAKLARQKTEDAKRKRKAQVLVERRRQEEVERRRQEEMVAVIDFSSAEIFLRDFMAFASKNSEEFDALKMAALFGPAQQLIVEKQYKSSESTFNKLVVFANKSKKFWLYRINRQTERKALVETTKKVVINNIKTLITQIKNKVRADPFAPDAYKLTKLIQTYDTSFKGKTLDFLQKTVGDLSFDIKGLGITPLVETAAVDKSVSHKVPKEALSSDFRSIPLLREIKENDIVFLANLSSEAPHAYRDLGGSIKFEKSIIVACAPGIQKWDRQSKLFFKNKLNDLYPNHQLREEGSCTGGIDKIDAVIARGVDLAKSRDLPSEVAFSKGFKNKTLSLIFTAKTSEVQDELKRRSILSSQYRDDILEESRSGFGAVSGDNKSPVACIVVSGSRDAHQKFIDQASTAREFLSGLEMHKSVDVELNTAFRELQKNQCGLIYADQKSLKMIIDATKISNLGIKVLPVWTSVSKVEKQAAILLSNKNTTQQSEADRLSELKRKNLEAAKQEAARKGELALQQARYRSTYGTKVTSLVARIDSQLKDMRSRIDTVLSERASLKSAVNKQDFWGALPGWYGGKRQKGWSFGSTVASPANYGTAIWQGRTIEAIVARVRFLMKHSDLGEYSDTCWYAGYLVDLEFSRQREPFVASCDNPGALKSWLVNNRFKTLWDLGVR